MQQAKTLIAKTTYPSKDVRYSKGFLAAPALSSTRLAIRFTDRNILRSSLPLEISPLDRTGFVNRLLSVNPGITIR